MINQTLQFIADNWQLVGAVGLVSAVGYWWYDEVEDEDDRATTIRDVGDRAQDTIEGTVGTLTAVVSVVAMLLVTFGSEFAQLLATMADPLLSAPIASGQLITGLLGALGLAGTISLSAGAFLFVALALLAITAAVKYR